MTKGEQEFLRGHHEKRQTNELAQFKMKAKIALLKREDANVTFAKLFACLM